MNISVVTPWFNHHELAEDYIEAVSVLSQDDEIIVIDNASDPPIPGALRLDENQGFARASNVGLREASCPAVLFLNNDIRMVTDDWLETLRAKIEPGYLTGAVLRYDHHGDAGGRGFPYLDGWCLAGMRDELLELGGFDEQYEEPAYYSDNDLALRARLAGMRLREVRLGLDHKQSVTVGELSPEVVRVLLINQGRFRQVVKQAVAA